MEIFGGIAFSKNEVVFPVMGFGQLEKHAMTIRR
jgi:hypothetical protein